MGANRWATIFLLYEEIVTTCNTLVLLDVDFDSCKVVCQCVPRRERLPRLSVARFKVNQHSVVLPH